jgi:ribonuclease HII
LARTRELIPLQRPGQDHFERLFARRGYCRVAGLDEAGRGPLAGPVVAAAVVLDPARPLEGIDDSKRLPEKIREALYVRITDAALAWAVGVVGPDRIDQINILRASLEAMRRAVQLLPERPDCLLIDGKDGIGLPIFQKPIVRGDARSVSIGAASILAKVTRDGIMRDLHRRWPHYNFSRHKGYPTPEHRAALRRYGPCPAHRRSFHGVPP